MKKVTKKVVLTGWYAFHGKKTAPESVRKEFRVMSLGNLGHYYSPKE